VEGYNGKAYPLGASIESGGVNFSVYSKNSTAVELLFFDEPDDPTPIQIIKLDPKNNRIFHYWHVFVPGIKAGQLYAYRVSGPYVPEVGIIFQDDKILLDPYSRGVVVPDGYNRFAEGDFDGSTAKAMKSVVVDRRGYDWEGDTHIRRPFSKTIIYEMHVGGFTSNPNSGVDPELRGTYAGLVEKIPYLVELGITAIELLPVFQFDEQDSPQGLTNYWGYSPVSFFAPHSAYSSRKDPLGPINEFRDMVKALHKAGIEVILDVVYNHTSENDETGPTFCYKGFENRAYYILDDGGSSYANYSGTGNTLNANHSVVRRMIRDSLRYWVKEMHVDGFRFDLASILTRNEQGDSLVNPPILWEIETDPVMAGTKLIAEAWDAGGLYQVGTFIGDHWKEWNGRFRDDVRSFLKGDRGSVSKLASRFLASPDIYGHENREPEQSINFVTCHDGFTLNDLVSYNEKHNQKNLEGNKDGNDDNLSWNFGVEGPTEDEGINKLRRRQIKNFITINLLALGVPMILMGDEGRRTQRGNNNAYCQDNEISWLDWDLIEENAEIHRFMKELIHYRLSLDLYSEHGLSLNRLLDRAHIQWNGVKMNSPDWSENSHSLALTLQRRGIHYHLIFNAYREGLEFELPQAMEGEGWRRVIDTYFDSPNGFQAPHSAPVIGGSTYYAHPHSVVLLVGEVS